MCYVWPCFMTIPSYLLYLTTLQIRKNVQKGLEYRKVYSMSYVILEEMNANMLFLRLRGS